MKIKWKQTKKQNLTWKYLRDHETTEIIFGGGAGGGKSFLGVSWVIVMCGMYPGTRWLIGRSKLKTLKETTLKTFFDVCRKWEIKEGEHYKYNVIDGVIKWNNGSEILLKDLFLYPQDPEFDELGSLELTGGFIDEINQIVFKAYEVVTSRIRYKLEEWCGECDQHGLNSGIITKFDSKNRPVEWECPNCKIHNGGLLPKLLGSCNPSKGWVKSEFYDLNKKNILPHYRKFIKALVDDNPNVSAKYVENLEKLKNKALKERLLNGNWEYDDDPSCLFDYDMINDMFSTDVTNKEDKWITFDVSRKGSDKMPVAYWEGFQVKEIQALPYETKKDTAKSSKWIAQYAQKKGVRISHIIGDEDGVGGGCIDNLKCVGFVNNGAVIQPPEAKDDKSKALNYANLKTQCSFELQGMLERGEVGIDPNCIDPDIKSMIIEEFGEIKEKDMDKDGKKQLVDKDVIKKNIGRSPDFYDTIMMRMYGKIKPKEIMPNIRTV